MYKQIIFKIANELANFHGRALVRIKCEERSKSSIPKKDIEYGKKFIKLQLIIVAKLMFNHLLNH